MFFPDQWHILSPRQCERKLHLKLLHARHLSYIQVGTQEYRGNWIVWSGSERKCTLSVFCKRWYICLFWHLQYTQMCFLWTKKVKDRHEVWKQFQKLQMLLSNYHLLQFYHKLPRFSQNYPTFGDFDDLGPF